MAINIKACGISDIGLLRNNNEDVFLTDKRYFIVADGMGGHQAGEIASREAVSTLSHLLQKNSKFLQKSLSDATQVISQAICDVNTHVFKMGRSISELKGMGSTLCVVYVHDDGVVFAHVGDSRIYRFREGILNLLTKDHSLLRELVDLGQIAEDRVSEFHYKNIITRAIGTEPAVEPSLQTTDIGQKDIFVLCSDGLSDLLSINEIENILKEASLLSIAAAQLISLSKKKGGHDNITLLLIEINVL